MLSFVRKIFFLSLVALPLVQADSLSYWERQGIVNINFDEPVVTRTVVENQYLNGVSAADKGHDLFSISGDDAHKPRVLWVDQDCLRIEPAPGTSISTEFCLKFRNGVRYQSGRQLKQYEYRFHAPATLLVNEELPDYPNGAALVSARHQYTEEARNLNPQSGVSYTFSRVKMDDKGDFFETGETVRGMVEQAQLRHGNSYSVLRSLALRGVKWEELRQDMPLQGYVVVRPERQLPANSIWRLTATPVTGSAFLKSNLGDIHVSRSLVATPVQTAGGTGQGDTANVLELRLNSLVDKEQLKRAFREMRLTLDGVETTLAEDGLTRTATVNGREVKVRYLGELEPQEFTLKAASPEARDEDEELVDEEKTTGLMVRYRHPSASPGMKLAIETPVPVMAECTLKAGLEGALGLRLEQDFTCRLSITPMEPHLSTEEMHYLPLQGKHKLELPAVNGSRVRARLRHWKVDELAQALPRVRQHLEQQGRRSNLVLLNYERAVEQARIDAGLARAEDMPARPAEYERAWEVLQNRIFLEGAGGRLFETREIALPGGANPLVGECKVALDLDALCGGQMAPGLYLLEMDFYPSEAVAAAARNLGLNPDKMVVRRDTFVTVSDLALCIIGESEEGYPALVLRHSDASAVDGALATCLEAENKKTLPVHEGMVTLPHIGGDILLQHGDDYCVLQPVGNPWNPTRMNTRAEGVELRAMLWTDRSNYRPGEKIFVRGYLRAVDALNRISHSRHRELELHFTAPDGTTLFKRLFNVDEYGAFSQELTLPEGEEDVCGRYEIRVGTTYPRTLSRCTVNCQVFRRDAFTVDTEDKTERVAPEEFVLKVQSQDFNGTPLSSGSAVVKLTSDVPVEGARESISGGRKHYVLQLKQPLGADGSTEFRCRLGERGTRSFTVQYEGSVVNDREEYRRFNGRGEYQPAEVVPRLVEGEHLKLSCACCGKAPSYGQSVKVTLRGTRRTATPLPNGFVLIRLQEEEIWSSWVNVKPDTDIFPLPLQELMKQHREEFGNEFKVELMGRDPYGRVFTREYMRWAGRQQEDAVYFRLSSSADGHRMVLESGMEGQGVLVVTCGQRSRVMPITVQQGRHEFAAPLQADEGGQVQVHAILPRRNAETGVIENILTARTTLNPPAPHRELQVELQLPAEAVRPGTRQNISGRVTLPNGMGTQAVVTLYAVDAGMLSQSRYEKPDVAEALSFKLQTLRLYPCLVRRVSYSLNVPYKPLPGLWQGEGLQADGSWKHQPWWMQGDMPRFRSARLMKSAAPMALGADDLSVGVGMDAEMESINAAGAVEGGAAPRLRTNFNPLAFWRSAVYTDAQGNFSTTCTMPDTLTTYRVFAVAADKEGGRFATQEGRFVVNQPVMLSVGAPLFMSTGDKMLLPLTVTNNTAAEGTWQVRMMEGGEPQQVTLAAGASTTLNFELNPQQSGTQKYRWVATGATGEDAVQAEFEVRHPSPLLKEAHHLVLARGQEALVPAQKLAADVSQSAGCQLELHVSANPLLHLQGAVDFLLEPPQGHAEYAASSLLPWLMYDRLAPLCPRMAQTPPASVPRIIQETIQNLMCHQQPDGGLPFWPGADESSLWTSAHVAMVLRMAEERGHELPWPKWYKLLGYLEKADMSRTSALTRYEAARALQNREAQRDALKAALETAPDSWWCSGSVRSDIEFLEYLRTNNDGRHEAFLRWIRTRAADYRHHSSWRSAWSLYALMTYIGNSPGAQVNAILRLPHGIAMLDRGVYRVQNPDMNFAYSSLKGTVYAVLRAKAQPQQTEFPGVTEKGLQMTRVYEKQGEDGIWRETADFAVGDVVRVSLTCAKAGEQDLHHLVLEDYLPSCMEAINPDVPGQAAGLEPLSWSEYFDHREYLADRVRGFCTRWPGRDIVNLRYYARVKRAGSATAPPAQAQLLYEPQTYGLSPSRRLESSAEVRTQNAE